MDSPVHDADDLQEFEAHGAGDRVGSAENTWLGEIVEQLECNPEECRQAVESLETLEPDLCLAIIEELATLGARPGASMLLRVLSSARDSTIRLAATAALGRVDDGPVRLVRSRIAGADGGCVRRRDERRGSRPGRRPFAAGGGSGPDVRATAYELTGDPVDGQGAG